ncbi:MAG TPA: hypothetical protein ENK57_12905 [Polyangiaceae bacterium]|nr:hypothetical protein [Polyangiaceae bacterium]
MTDHDHSPADSHASTDAEIRMLRQIVEEVRDQPPPEVDWDTLEARVLARVAADEASRRRQAKAAPRWGAVAGFAAAAAAVVMLAAGIGGDTADPSHEAVSELVARADLVAVPRGPNEPALYTVVGMQPDAAVESGAEPMRFTLPGVVTWTLAPHSRVVVETVPVPRGASTMPHVVRLEQGRIDADVVPRQGSNQLLEAFVVEAGATRVAVHGTVFSVERRADVVDVEVTRGSVTVGPAHHRGVTTGHLMVSPKRASFRAGRVVRGGDVATAEISVAIREAGEPTEEVIARTGTSKTPAPEPEPVEMAAAPVAQPSAPPRVDEAPQGENEELPNDKPPVLSVAAAQSRVLGCLASAAPDGATAGTKVTVSSQVTAVLSTEGEVVSVQFVPPLRPDLQQRCAGVLFGQRVDGKGKVTFPVQLKAD